MDIRLFNADVTVTNPLTGNHQCYLVHTKKIKHRKCNGEIKDERFRYLAKREKHGYVNFAKIDDHGKIHLFPEFRNAQYRVHVAILLHPERQAEEHGLEYNFSCSCRICGRTLRNPDSIKSGIGPVCIGYVGLEDYAKKIKKMTDKERFTELRAACHAGHYQKSLIAMGYMDSPDIREAARHYMDNVSQHTSKAA